MGELACLFNKEFSIDCDLEIVKLEVGIADCFNKGFILTPVPIYQPLKLQFSMAVPACWRGQTRKAWTTKPFEILEPWIDAYELSEAMNSYSLEEYYSPVYFRLHSQSIRRSAVGCRYTSQKGIA